MDRMVALLAVAALVAGACSKDSGKAPIQRTPINLACVMNPDFSLVHLALAQGYFVAEGLDVKVKLFAVGKAALAAVIAGEADFATALETPVMFAVLGGEKLGIIASVGSSDRNQALVANRAAGIAKPGDLRGKAIGVTTGTAAEYFLDSYLVANGIGQGGLRIVGLQPQELIPALQSGKVAAAEMWNPLIAQAGAALGEKSLVLYGENIYTAYNCIVGEQSFVGKNPNAVKAFIRALLLAEAFLGKSPAKAMSRIAQYVATDESALRPMMSLFRFKVALDQSLLLSLEDEARWAMAKRPDEFRSMPNYLEYIHADALSALAPDKVRLVR